MRSWQTLLIGQSDPAACDVTADRLQFPPSQTDEQSLCSSLIFWVNNQFYQFECFRVFVLQKRFYQTLFTSTWLILGLRQLLLSLCLKQTVINFSVWIEKLCDNILQRDHRNVSAERVSTAEQKMMNNKKTDNTNICLTSQMVCCHGDLSSVNTNNNNRQIFMIEVMEVVDISVLNAQDTWTTGSLRPALLCTGGLHMNRLVRLAVSQHMTSRGSYELTRGCDVSLLVVEAIEATRENQKHLWD